MDSRPSASGRNGSRLDARKIDVGRNGGGNLVLDET